MVFILSLHASIVSVHSPPQLHIEPPQLLKFYFDAITDQALGFDADPDPKMIWIHVDSDPQNW
jgi:hypothetical protein